MWPYAQRNAELHGFHFTASESNELEAHQSNPSDELESGARMGCSDVYSACSRSPADRELFSRDIGSNDQASVDTVLSGAMLTNVVQQLSLVQGTVEELPFRDQSYDAVVCTLVSMS
jgi:hypothetical protein